MTEPTPMRGALPASPTLEDAIVLATEAHRGQTYPSPEREPYVCHPLRVMLAVRTDVERLAAVLHDVIEDTAVTLDDLRARAYRLDVVNAVDCLTHRPNESHDAYLDRVVTNEVACRVKLADLADNLANNLRHPPTPRTLARIERYLKARTRIEAALAAHPTSDEPELTPPARLDA